MGGSKDISCPAIGISGRAMAFYRIGHATRSKLEFGVAGKDGLIDDLKNWNAAPVAAP